MSYLTQVLFDPEVRQLRELAVSDPLLLRNCPRCGEPLLYVTSKRSGGGQLGEAGEVHVYVCSHHGQYELSADAACTVEPGPPGKRDRMQQ